MWAGAGVVEAIFCLLTITQGIIPPTINYETPDPECDLDYVPNVARRAEVKIALSNSFGFGSTNGCLSGILPRSVCPCHEMVTYSLPRVTMYLFTGIIPC